MSGLFDMFGTDDPKQAAYMAMAAGLLGGKGSFNQVLGGAMTNSQKAYQTTRQAQIEAQLTKMQLDELARKAKAEAERPALIQQAIASFPQAGVVQGPPTEDGQYATKNPSRDQYLKWALGAHATDPNLAKLGFGAMERLDTREDQQRSRAESQAAQLQAMMDKAKADHAAAIERQREKIEAEAKAAQLQLQGRKDLAQMAAALRPPRADEPLEAVVGPDGKPVFVSRRNAVGKTPYQKSAGATEKNLTEDQGKAVSWLERMEQSEEVIKNAPESALQSTGSLGGMLGATIGSVPYLGNTGAAKLSRNMVEAPERQAVRNAQEVWVQGLLRSDTGAAYKDMEKDDIIRAFFWQPGESEIVRGQKDLAREGVRRAMLVRAGPAVDRLSKVPKTGVTGKWTIEVEK
jgi:hypothetical protein